MLAYVACFIAAAVISFAAAYPIRALALRFDLVDHPEKRKMHQIPIPLLGGVAIFISFGIVSAAAFVLLGDLQTESLRSYLGLMAGTALILMLGVYDDVRGLKAIQKAAGQTVAAIAVVALGGRVELFTNPLGSSFELGWLGVPLAVLWIVGVTNAVNLIDGLDGLAAGIGTIAALGLFAVAYPGNTFVAAMTIVLAGSTLGFLKHNFYPAKMFLGDAGSMFIGFTLAVIGLHGSFKATTATILFLPIIVLGVPIFDTLFAIARRAHRRISPFKADREHIHHRLIRAGLHHRNVVLVLYFLCSYLALTAYSISQLPYRTAFLFLVLLTMAGIIGLRTLRFIEERLETRLAAETEAVAEGAVVRLGSGPGRRGGGFSTLACEVGGFREDFGEPSALESLGADVLGMLSRRVRVHSVIAEPSAPGHVLLIIRTARLDPALAALVRDGLSWYLEDHRTRFSTREDFPAIRWIDTGRALPPREKPQETPEKGVVAVPDDRARAFGS